MRGIEGIWASALLFAAACASEPPPEEPLTPSDRKQRMLFGTELAMRRVIEDARRDAVNLRAEYHAAIAAAPRSWRLGTTEPSLTTFGETGRESRRDAIERAFATTESRHQLLFDHYANALWVVAERAGELERGSDLGTRTGYRELDDKVDAALLQVERRLDVEGLEQVATFSKHEDVVLDRQIREELPGLGVLSLFKSAPVDGLFAPGQEGQAVVATFTRSVSEAVAVAPPAEDDAAKPALPPDAGLSFVQAVRRRVERAGIVISETPWHLDPATPGGRGIVPLRAEIDASRSVATEVCVPSVDTVAPSFHDVWDHVLVSEYRTVLRRNDTGATLATIGWQVRWNVDFKGSMRVLVDKGDKTLEEDPVVPALLADGGPK
jgi:hypothetical protein